MENNNEKPILIYQKTADKKIRKIAIPKAFIDKYGYTFSMEIYKDRIVLLPINEDEED